MTSPLADDVKSAIVTQFISTWKEASTPTVAIDADTYRTFFYFLPVVHTVHEKATGKPIIVLVKREESIELTKSRYQLQGKQDAKRAHHRGGNLRLKKSITD